MRTSVLRVAVLVTAAMQLIALSHADSQLGIEVTGQGAGFEPREDGTCIPVKTTVGAGLLLGHSKHNPQMQATRAGGDRKSVV